MPKHRQVTTCRKNGGPVSKFCSCEHCCLSVCTVCGAYEGSLTTHCPGEGVSFDRQREVYETNLDYTDDRGWHQGEPMLRRTPLFEDDPAQQPQSPITLALRNNTHTPHWAPVATHPSRQIIDHCSCGWQCPSDALYPAEAFITHVAQTRQQSITTIETLARKAITWAQADRRAEDNSAALTRIQDEVNATYPRDRAPNETERALLATFERARIDFQLTDQHAQKCDDEFRQLARKLLADLEARPLRLEGGGPGDTRLIIGGEHVILHEGEWIDIEQGPRGEFIRVLARGSATSEVRQP